jgi:hypothetical protein
MFWMSFEVGLESRRLRAAIDPTSQMRCPREWLDDCGDVDFYPASLAFSAIREPVASVGRENPVFLRAFKVACIK